ncbi:MAG: fimbria/pilus periplasmic chaperone [Candidatus Electrothrix communis]|nr:molecular chaperone [Desulfobulbus sp. US4]WLE97239.1 MAG: fimbria/pilus periplasmic chaperone [Candidatus Electrothrix communis]
MKYSQAFVRILLGVFLLICHTELHAANLGIWPLKVIIWPEKATGSVNLTNKDDKPVNLQISATSWDMNENGKFIEADTGDFVFFPRMLTIPANEEKAVRVGYQGNFPALEKSYRLLIQELPPVRNKEELEDGQSKMGVTYIMKLSLPLFVMPSKEPPKPELAVDGVKTDEKGMSIGIRATGTHHVQITKIELELVDSAGVSVASGENETRLLRILPQRRVFVPVALDMDACDKAEKLLIKVHADGLTEPAEEKVELKKGTCEPSSEG